MLTHSNNTSKLQLIILTYTSNVHYFFFFSVLFNIFSYVGQIYPSVSMTISVRQSVLLSSRPWSWSRVVSRPKLPVLVLKGLVLITTLPPIHPSIHLFVSDNEAHKNILRSHTQRRKTEKKIRHYWSNGEDCVHVMCDSCL